MKQKKKNLKFLMGNDFKPLEESKECRLQGGFRSIESNSLCMCNTSCSSNGSICGQEEGSNKSCPPSSGSTTTFSTITKRTRYFQHDGFLLTIENSLIENFCITKNENYEREKEISENALRG